MKVARRRLLRGPCRERVLCSSEGGPSKVAECCSGGRAERVLGSGEGGRRRLLNVVPGAVQREY